MNVYLQCECDAKKSGSTPCQYHLSPNSVNGVKMTEMAQSEPQVYNPHIKKVLKSYQSSAMTSLSGPGMAEWNKLSVEPDLKKGLLVSQATGISATPSPVRTGSVPAVNGNHKKVPSIAAPGAVEMNGGKYAVASSEYDPFLAPPPFPIQQMPILTAPDQSRSERSETTLEGETISCFVVGGEKRLCLPQILNSVLRDFSLQQINAVCDELQIFCSRCNHEQLEVLKVTGILPFTAPSCGLITKTDAERLCNALLHSSPPRALVEDMPPEKRREQFKVYHECFGKCKGLYTPDRYSSPNARCIECTECHGLFSPQKFVCHAHKSLENRTCHWGFDSVNWRSYILLAKDQANMEQLQTKLDDMKAQFDYVNKYKRKQVEPQEEKDPTKKVKYTEDMYYSYMYDPMLAAYWYPPTAWSRVSAFRPWSPMVSKDGKSALPPTQSSFMREALPQSLPSFLSHGPPVLLNPERVVPISETERFERHYQPNVALAPPSAQTQANQKVSYNIAKPVCHLENTKTLQQGPVTNPEIEISTDTDETLSDSTISAESTDYVPDKQKVELDSTERKKVVDVVNGSDSQSPSEADLEPLRKLLEDHGLTNNIVDDVLKEVGKIQEKYEEKLSLALQAKKLLQHEMDFLRAAKKEKLREAAETKRGLRKELDHLRSENERKMKEAQEIQQKLRLELEATRSRKGDKIHEVAARANLTAENEQLRTKLEIKEAELRRLEKELKKSKYQQAANEQAKALATTSLSAIIKREVVEKVPSTVGD